MPVGGRKRRYLVIKIISQGRVDGGAFRLALVKSLAKLFGEVGLAKASLKFLSFNDEEKAAVVGCDRAFLNELRAAVALMSEVNNKAICPFVAKVSGTVKGAKVALKEGG
ncbi:TPA: hypothetical protein EYP26_02430 [Candidatus Bathyarchaeota archaeon]|nr:hypothetical protein [Candidatus Bathyarchaeota archaeon]